MCAINQGIHARASFEIEGLCESPHDFPAKWAAIIYGYFDESGEDKDGFFVLAGFVGNRSAWKKFVPLWQEALGDHRPLHMKTMRLGSKNAPRRHGEALKRLAKVPKLAGLKPFAGSVRTKEYRHRVKGTIAELILKGYPTALAAVIDAVVNGVPKQDRIEFIFEEQVEYAAIRAQTFSTYRKIPGLKTHHNKSRIAKDSSIEKPSILLEPSDYLAYAILQQVLDPNSQKAQLSMPILKECKAIHHRDAHGTLINGLIDEAISDHPEGRLPLIDKYKRAFFIQKMKDGNF